MFQSFSTRTLRSEQPHPARAFDEARELISRYPKLDGIELARLIDLYRSFSALDMALVLSDEGMAPGLDRFSADHRSSIRSPFRAYAALVGYAVVGLAVLVWAMIFAS